MRSCLSTQAGLKSAGSGSINARQAQCLGDFAFELMTLQAVVGTAGPSATLTAGGSALAYATTAAGGNFTGPLGEVSARCSLSVGYPFVDSIAVPGGSQISLSSGRSPPRPCVDVLNLG